MERQKNIWAIFVLLIAESSNDFTHSDVRQFRNGIMRLSSKGIHRLSSCWSTNTFPHATICSSIQTTKTTRDIYFVCLFLYWHFKKRKGNRQEIVFVGEIEIYKKKKTKRKIRKEERKPSEFVQGWKFHWANKRFSIGTFRQQ